MKYLEHHEFDVSGTHIEFLAPRHNHNTVSATPAIKDNSINLYDFSQFSRYNEKSNDEPASMGLSLKWWRYFGIPLLDGTGVIGDVTFNPDISHMPEFNNLFHPKHLECAIERYIYRAPNTYRFSGQCRQKWRLVKINGTTWLNYISQGSAGYRNAEEVYESVWHTPITEQHLLTVRFDEVIRFKRTRLSETYDKLIETVMNSFKVTLSEDALNQQAAIKKEFPTEKLPTSLPAYEFDVVDILSEHDLIPIVSKENNFDSSVSDRIFDKKLKEADNKQKQKQKETRELILASHLRFKENN